MATLLKFFVSVSAILIVLPQILAVENDESTALKVGGPLMFMVADFAPGSPVKGHCGCPSVMIKNNSARAIVIWSKTADDATLALAQGANGQLGESRKRQGYLILFDENDAAFEATAKKAAFSHLSFGNARHAWQQIFKAAEVDAEVAQVVMLIDDRQVASLWKLKANELTSDKAEAILKESAAFLR